MRPRQNLCHLFGHLFIDVWSQTKLATLPVEV
jgi:hypothetical protein